MSSSDNLHEATPQIPYGDTIHEARDGRTSIVRFSGGRIAAHQWETLAQLAEEHGDGTLHLTSRSAVQIRGISDADAFAEHLKETQLLRASFLPVVASPSVDQTILDAVDRTLSTEKLDDLSSRILIGIDDGTGDVLSASPDFGFVILEDVTHIIVGGEITEYTTTDMPATLSALLSAWNEHRSTQWRVHEHKSFIEYVEATFTDKAAIPAVETPSVPSVGWMQNESKVTLGFGVPFSTLTAKVAHILGAIGAETTVTTWPSVLIHDLGEADAEAVAKVLAPQGMIFDAHSPWLAVSACVGTRGCSRALSDVESDAQQYASSAQPVGQRVYFSGCSHKCGRPLGTTIDYVATGDGEYDTNEE